MRKWRKNEIKTGPLQRMFSSNMPLLWYCYAIVVCSNKRGALEENIRGVFGYNLDRLNITKSKHFMGISIS